jgi:lipopolysaccharide biosynthesis glycosyltransferase
LSGYEKLLYLDGDMLVLDHAPSPFDLCVEEDTMYAVSDRQGVNIGNSTWEDWIYNANVDKIIEKYPAFKKPTVERYFNSGFMLFKNTPRIRETFDLIDGNREFEFPTCYDQTVINMIVHNTLSVVMLPEEWNYIGWDREFDPEAYIHHYVQIGPGLA